jgi:hypothetical protein
MPGMCTGYTRASPLCTHEQTSPMPDDAPSLDCTIKGNMNRSGECIYHQQGGRWYAKINMDSSKGKRWLCSVQEPEAAGCRESNSG